jgi:sec-independent protein translocase protein TatA
MGKLLTPTHLLLVAVIAFVLFGGNKLPELAKGLGASLRIQRWNKRPGRRHRWSGQTSADHRA